jgi:hypothetical protein
VAALVDRTDSIEIAPLDGDELVTGRTVVVAGADLLVFGGARWDHGSIKG